MTDYDPPLPASDTKHLFVLHHPVPDSSITLTLKQQSESTGTTGTTLWLSAQLLALYFTSLPKPTRGKVVLDLGSGIGFVPLCLAARGYRVVATDIQHVIDSVLNDNVRGNLNELRLRSDGDVQVTPLDWEDVARTGSLPTTFLDLKIDIITTSDTIYAPHLLEPLLKTLRKLSIAHQPTIYLGLERRDSALVDQALNRAGSMGLSLKRVDKDKVDRLMDEAKWAKEEWDDVEIWKGKFTKASLAAATA